MSPPRLFRVLKYGPDDSSDSAYSLRITPDVLGTRIARSTFILNDLGGK